jgi:hypothetical protein
VFSDVGGGTQQWVIGISGPGVVPLSDRLTESSEHSGACGFVEVFHIGVGAEFKLVGKFDLMPHALIGLLVGVGGNSTFSCRVGSIE